MTSEIHSTSETSRGSAQVATLLQNAIRDIGIPPCPDILEQIRVEIHKEEPNLNRLTSIINTDVSISAGLIAISNSPFFGLQRRVRSVTEALMLLGLSVSSQAIAGLILQKIFPTSRRLDRFWHASASIARLCGWLTQHTPNSARIGAEDAYTFGLFRDSGIPILLNRFEYYPEVLKKANAEQELGFTDVENALCATNHAMIGGLLAQSWWLPEEICMAIRHHHDYSGLEPASKSRLSSGTRALIATALLAEHLFQHHTELAPSLEWDKGGEISLQTLGLTTEDLDQLYVESAALLADHP